MKKIVFFLVSLFINLAVYGQIKEAKKYYNEGVDYFEKREFVLAKASFTAVIRIDPKDKNAYLSRGDCLAELNEFDLAIQDYLSAIKIDRSWALAHFNLGQVYLSIKNLDSALIVVAEAIRLNPKDESYYFWRAPIYTSMNECDKSLADYTKAHSLNPDAYDIPYFQLGFCFFNKALFEKAVNMFSQAIRLDSLTPYLYTQRGDTYLGLREYNKAINDYVTAAKLDSSLGIKLYNLGKSFYAKENYDLAIKILNESIKLNSKNSDNYFLRGNAYLKKNDIVLATNDFKEVIQLKPSDIGALTILGEIESSSQNYDQAIKMYTEALKLNPDDKNLYSLRGYAHYVLNNYDLAILDYSEVTKLDVLSTKAYKVMGEIWYKKQNYQMAIRALTEAIVLDPKDKLMYTFMGNSYSNLNAYDSAIINYTEVTKLDPLCGYAFYQLGQSGFLKQDYDLAIKSVTEAINLEPQNQYYYHLRGSAFLNKKEYESALVNFNEMVRFDDKNVMGQMGRAKVFTLKKDFDKAIEVISLIIQVDSLTLDIFTERGNLYFAKKQFDSAIQDYTKALQINAKSYNNYRLRGAGYSKKGEYSLALKDYQEYVLTEKSAVAFVIRGFLYLELKQSELAFNDFAEAIRIDPKNPDGYIGKGRFYRITGQFDLSLVEYAKALEINAKLPLAIIEKAKTQHELGQYQLAIDNFEMALQIDQSYPAVYFDIISPLIRTGQFEKAKINADKYEALIGQAYMDEVDTKFYKNYLLVIANNLPKSQYDEAIVNLEKALSDYTFYNTKNDLFKYNYIDILSLKGLVLEKLDRKAEAQVTYTQSLGLRSNQPEIKNALSQIVLPLIHTVTVKSDTTAPNIQITSPAINRGLKLVQTNPQVLVTGIAKDSSGIYEVTINGKEANLDAAGNFSAYIPLSMGDNQLIVSATDTKMNKATYPITINRSSLEVVAPIEIPIITAAEPQIKAEGKYFALIIGIEDYVDESINNLDQPIKDANSLYDVLLDKYTFNKEDITFLKNPTRDQLFVALENLSHQTKSIDNLLIFYAGHGFWDESRSQGYWFPSDAKKSNRSSWLTNADLKEYISAIKTKHTLLISDACFSGGIFKGRGIMQGADRAIKELYQMPSRKAMTSGTLKEVPDQSVFIQYLVKRLTENGLKYLSSEQLFSSLRMAVINNSPNGQVPQFGEIKEAGDEGGDFIFIKK